jgi:hypothetical protein
VIHSEDSICASILYFSSDRKCVYKVKRASKILREHATYIIFAVWYQTLFMFSWLFKIKIKINSQLCHDYLYIRVS